MRHTDAHANLARLAASSLSPSARAVFLVMTVYADDDGLCWPAVPVIGTAAGMNPANVRRHLVALVDAGLVSIIRGGGRGHTNLYRLPVEVVHIPRGAARGTRADPRDEVIRESTGNGAVAPTMCPLCGQPVAELGKWRHPDCVP